MPARSVDDVVEAVRAAAAAGLSADLFRVAPFRVP